MAEHFEVFKSFWLYFYLFIFIFLDQVLIFITWDYIFGVTVVWVRGNAIASYKYCIWLLTRILLVEMQSRLATKLIRIFTIQFQQVRLRGVTNSPVVECNYCIITVMAIGTYIQCANINVMIFYLCYSIILYNIVLYRNTILL